MNKVAFLLALLIVSSFASADTFLPLLSLKDQSDTAHCWSYSSSHMLESRSLIRDSEYINVNVEKDVKYWVDYERMQYIYHSKHTFYLDTYEGGWQIEYMETLLKHGKQIKENHPAQVQITYQESGSTQHIDFSPVDRPTPDSKLPSFDEFTEQLISGFKSDVEAENAIRDYLDRYYGPVTMTTKWDNNDIPLIDSKTHLLGSDLQSDKVGDNFVLIKPATDGELGWTKYLEDRYDGYRYDAKDLPALIRLSLDRAWPVTYDIGYHALTMIGYKFNEKENMYYYAIADSIDANISWQSETSLMSELNLATFYKPVIAEKLTPKSADSRSFRGHGVSRDVYDHTVVPPGF